MAYFSAKYTKSATGMHVPDGQSSMTNTSLAAIAGISTASGLATVKDGSRRMVANLPAISRASSGEILDRLELTLDGLGVGSFLQLALAFDIFI